MPLCKLHDKSPFCFPGSWIAPNAYLIGDATLEAETSIWFGAVLRAEFSTIHVGRGSNIQDNTVVHVDFDTPTRIGKNVTIGHNCIIHGCTIQDYALIGMGSIILNKANVGPYCLVAAGTLIAEGKVIPEGHLVMGMPGKIVRPLTLKEKESLEESAQHYKMNAQKYARELEVLPT